MWADYTGMACGVVLALTLLLGLSWGLLEAAGFVSVAFGGPWWMWIGFLIGMWLAVATWALRIIASFQ
jgi:hypothetical protein